MVGVVAELDGPTLLAAVRNSTSARSGLAEINNNVKQQFPTKYDSAKNMQWSTSSGGVSPKLPE